jgi:hypothetical protein
MVQTQWIFIPFKPLYQAMWKNILATILTPTHELQFLWRYWTQQGKLPEQAPLFSLWKVGAQGSNLS